MEPIVTGKAASRTKVSSHPLANATAIPEIAMAITYRTKGILSLRAPWNAMVSAENWEES